jgi:16S rRNA processing protein RimM
MTEQPENAPPESRPDRLTIGRIVSPHGIRGEFRMYIYTHFPERIPELPYIFIGESDEPRKLSRARQKDNTMIMRVEGITSREQADELRGQIIQVDRENAAPLEEGEYYHFEIIGLTAVTESGETLGKIADIIETGANDVYVIKDDEGNETLIPALYDSVPEIDLEAGKMVVRPPRYSDEG